MFCPSCGASVPSTNFCENCGSPLSDVQGTTPINQPTEAVSGNAFAGAQPTSRMPQPTEPVSVGAYASVQPTDQMPQPVESGASPYVAEVPGDSAWQAQPQQAYQASQTTEIPYQAPSGDYTPSSNGPIPPYQNPSPYQPPTGGKAPNAAFVLVIVGLVLSVLYVTFVPGIVCSIIGLVLNAGYNKKNLYNPRKTATTVVGIIGVVIAILCLLFTIALGVLTAQVMDKAEEQGINITTDNVQVTTDSDGALKINVTDSKSSAAASGTGTAQSLGSDDSSAGSSSESSSQSSSADASTDSSSKSGALSSDSVSSDAASSAASASSAAVPAIAYNDSKYHDGEWNPTLYAITELTGAEMSDLLEGYNYSWDDDVMGWVASDGSMFIVTGLTGEMSKSQVQALPKGGAGEAVVMGLLVTGYDSSSAAFKALANDVVVEDGFYDDDLSMGIVQNSSGDRYLVMIAESEGAQEMVLFPENSVTSGVFDEFLGVDAGGSLDEVWKFIKIALSL